MAKVTIIPSTTKPTALGPLDTQSKRKVAAYARVSTDSDEQYTSYEAQVNFYTKMIKAKPEWEFVRVYADEGISGTNIKGRAEFKQMIDDAMAGKIDLIITKSISRFARNTLDTISTTRALKAKGIEVYFEKENLWTFDSKSEFVLTIMASIAQEESRSISQNVTVGKRWGMQEGKVSFAYKNFLGYKKENGKIVIDKEQAKIVRLIYRKFLVEGMTCSGIAAMLKKAGVLTPSGKSNNWQKNTVYSILTNEKYKGDALLQKTYIVDYLEHKAKKNEGEIPQYYVTDSHPAIIDRDEWEQVQTELKRRAEIGAKYSASSIFASKLICADCGGFYGKKKWHSTNKYAKCVYQCNRKFEKGKAKCITPSLTEEEIKRLFIKAYNLAMGDKARMIADTKEAIHILTDTTEIEKNIASLNSEMEVLRGLAEKLVQENASMAQPQDEYEKKYANLTEKYEAAKNELEKAIAERKYKNGQALKLNAFMKKLEQSDTCITEWDDELWMILIENAVVHRDKSITFRFYSGKNVRVKNHLNPPDTGDHNGSL